MLQWDSTSGFVALFAKVSRTKIIVSPPSIQCSYFAILVVLETRIERAF